MSEGLRACFLGFRILSIPHCSDELTMQGMGLKGEELGVIKGCRVWYSGFRISTPWYKSSEAAACRDGCCLLQSFGLLGL